MTISCRKLHVQGEAKFPIPDGIVSGNCAEEGEVRRECPGYV